ncbi:L-fucose/L-arabinose isomerase family protein [Propionivibrio soli]|uniref:L-fucose/L-arabinose isomerase family protein n=1 Tax=Propionivibrio soli TaxID=2976531 RepID=UPI0021E92B0E|nr:L-fucose/L-arabinose isomerase family protein [Propionivibrio soli]
MNSERPRIGVIAVGRSTFDVDYAREVFESAWAGLSRLPIEIVGEKVLHFDSDPALAAFSAVNARGIDVLLLLQVTFTDASVCATIARDLGVPLIVWTFPEARTGGRLRLNSFCGVNLASHALSRLGKTLDNVHGAPESTETLAKIEELARAAAVVRKLAEARILVVGEHPVGFDACNYDGHMLESRFGVRSERVAVDEFIESVKRLPDSSADEAFARRAADFPNLAEMDQAATHKTLKVYAELRSRAESEGFAGIAVRCWPEFFTQYGCAACGAIALMNEDRRPGGCEADMYGVVSSLILQWTSEKGVFNTDLVDIDAQSDTVVFWHCGQAPIEMADPDVQPIATIHSNRKLPLLSQFPLKPGRITLCRVTQGQGKLRMMLAGGEMQKAPLAYSGTSGVARLDANADVFRQRLLDAGMEHHCSLTYGEHRPVLRQIAKYLGLELVELT